MSFEQDSFLHNESNEDPIEKIEKAFNEINESLCKDLLNEIMKISPYNFEDLVIKLLVKMGYGSEKFNEKALTQKSFDEGIDGIVNADKFGFESIYTQAKRWDPRSTIGRPEIQKFIGALVGKGASKGLFITTAQFTREAINYAERQYNPKIVLVDGKYLTELMLEYDIGTNISKTFKIKRIDSEFFRNEVSLAYCS
jgi:restriction system protein